MLLVAGSAFTVRAQDVNEQYQSALREYRQLLDEKSQEIADEYLEILEQVLGLIEDYSEDLASAGETQQQAHPESIDRLKKGLEDRRYVESHEKLLEDISEVINDIKHIESQHKAKYETNTPKSCRLIRNLRRELVIVADLVEDYSDNQPLDILKDKGIQKYLEQSLKEATRALAEVSRNLSKHGLEVDTLRGAMIPQPPVIVVPPIPPGQDRDWVILSDVDDDGLSRVFADTLKVRRSDRPIFITNPTGGLRITGWDKDYLVAELGYAVSADTRSKERAFASKISLQATDESQGYRITADFPRVTDSRTKILKSVLMVSVPYKNMVSADNSFGDVYVADLGGGLRLQSSYSSINIQDVVGKVLVEGSMGGISISGVEGSLEVSNSYASIAVDDCVGPMDLTNAYELIAISQSRGDVDIVNTGTVRIEDHVGTITVENSYGAITVTDVEGDLTVRNSYNPVVARDISGTTALTNIYSTIEAVEIGGRLSANSDFGNITVDNPRGPIELVGTNGNITLLVDNRLVGRSSVYATHGTIDLTVPSESNLYLKARAIGGKITGKVPVGIRSEGRERSFEFSYGSGQDSLAVSGNNVSIVFNEH